MERNRQRKGGERDTLSWRGKRGRLSVLILSITSGEKGKRGLLGKMCFFCGKR